MLIQDATYPDWRMALAPIGDENTTFAEGREEYEREI